MQKQHKTSQWASYDAIAQITHNQTADGTNKTKKANGNNQFSSQLNNIPPGGVPQAQVTGPGGTVSAAV
jgi:hypothetical protein